ncbi:hypothetical protein F4780DRAFT_747367 [Xylariomycetidae sp. FL0641]|nr:hypothetical protein F4780DRAFT_747367 [Xylariomycetidae sp. FL0641]
MCDVLPPPRRFMHAAHILPPSFLMQEHALDLFSSNWAEERRRQRHPPLKALQARRRGALQKSLEGWGCLGGVRVTVHRGRQEGLMRADQAVRCGPQPQTTVHSPATPASPHVHPPTATGFLYCPSPRCCCCCCFDALPAACPALALPCTAGAPSVGTILYIPLLLTSTLPCCTVGMFRRPFSRSISLSHGPSCVGGPSPVPTSLPLLRYRT